MRSMIVQLQIDRQLHYSVPRHCALRRIHKVPPWQQVEEGQLKDLVCQVN